MDIPHSWPSHVAAHICLTSAFQTVVARLTAIRSTSSQSSSIKAMHLNKGDLNKGDAFKLILRLLKDKHDVAIP